MTRRVALSTLRTVVGTIVGIAVGVLATSGLSTTRNIAAAHQGRGQGAPATPPSPCGPKATLPEKWRQRSRLTSRCVQPVGPSWEIPPIAAIVIRSSTALTAARVSRSCAAFAAGGEQFDACAETALDH